MIRRISLLSGFGLLAALLLTSAGGATTYHIDAVHSNVGFSVRHIVSRTSGAFTSFEGTVDYDPAHPEESAVTAAVDVGSIDTNNKRRDGHLKSPDFFSTKEFPTISFVSKSWKKTGDASYEISGDLTLHGVTKSVTIPVTKVGEGKDPWGGFRIGFDGALKIKRTDYGMSKMVGAAGDEITLHIGIEGMRKA